MKKVKTISTKQFKVSHRLSVSDMTRKRGEFGEYPEYKELEEIGGGTVIFSGPKAESEVLKYLKSLHKNKSEVQNLRPGEHVKLTVVVNGELPAMPGRYLPALPMRNMIPVFVPADPAIVSAPARPKRRKVAKVIKLPEVKPAHAKWHIAI